MELLNANYVIALLMEHASFVKLRHDRKDLDHIHSSDAATLSWHSYACIICVFALCCCMVFLQRISKERGWCQFEEPTPVSDSTHVLGYESRDGSRVEESK